MKSGTLRGKYKFRGRRQRTDKIGKEVSCTGKIRWWDKKSAQSHADEINEVNVGDRKVRAYRCVHAPKDRPHFHVGREPKKL